MREKEITSVLPPILALAGGSEAGSSEAIQSWRKWMEAL